MKARPHHLQPSGFGAHLATTALAWTLLFLASPGVLDADGSALLAVVAVGLWAARVSRPPRGKERWLFLAEALGASVGLGGLMWWIIYVVPLGVLYIGLAQGLYMGLGGLLLRRLPRGLSLAFAVPLAWSATEALRSYLVPPLGLGWMRLGHYAHHHLWFASSASIWGLEGLGFVLAALAGGALGSWRSRRPAPLFLGSLPLLLAASISLGSSAPETVQGPRVLLVQPGFSQERKMEVRPYDNFRDSLELTRRGLERNRSEGGEEVDLVSWGESMLFLPLVTDGALAFLEGGAEIPPWVGGGFDLETARRLREVERDWVEGALFGRGASGPGVLPEGTSFLAGADLFARHGDGVRRFNSVALYGAEGGREFASKRFLVPGAETLIGLEHQAWAREVALRFVGYLPVLVPASETGILELVTRDGERYRFGATVCFDNSFLRAYTEPTLEEELAFHLVASNEAWYRDSCEMDQMVAFSRLAALSTGISVVRATNSGLSLVLGPDGREVARVRTRGQDRGVAGTLAVDVPVPAPGAHPGPTFYARTQPFWGALWVQRALVPLTLGARSPAREGNRGATSG